VIGPGTDPQDVGSNAGIALAGNVFRRLAAQFRAQILVRRNVDELRPRAIGRRRPVLAAPSARAERRRLVGPGLVLLIDDRPSRIRLDAFEDVMADKGLPGDEVDLSGGALELPEIAVAGNVHEAFHGHPGG